MDTLTSSSISRLLLGGALSLLVAAPAEARESYNFNSGWLLSSPDKATASLLKKSPVTLPHAWNEDFSFKVSTYEMPTGVVWYKKKFSLPEMDADSRVILEFEGARQGAEVYVNGTEVGLSENGVMAFGFDITPYLVKGENSVEVRTDNSFDYKEKATGTTWQWNTKSFNVGYGGLPKNVWLHVVDPVHQTFPIFSNLGTTGVYVYGSDYDVPTRTATINVESQVQNHTDSPVTRALEVAVTDQDGKTIAQFKGEPTYIPANSTATLHASKRVGDLNLWSWGYGYIYDVHTSLAGGEKSDPVTTKTGFRKIEFKNGMIYLNDRVMMVHGYAQRTTNEWPGVGQAMPAWLSDYSNDLIVKSGGNVVRWMHTCPSKQDVESCDRVGLIEAMPAGDAEHDSEGRKWTQRLELMRDAIIYHRNSPSILFYECGNQRITSQHMKEMIALRNQYDPYGARAIGSREMLDKPEAEYGGEMLYINKSDTKPMWMMEYCRDEGHRLYWNSWSYPFHPEGDGPLYRNAPATAYNHNSDELVAENVRRWYDYWIERPGSGTKVNSGGTKIIFSDTQSHGRSADNYRVSGVVDPMRIEKDAFFAHQVMWDGWVDDLKPRTYIVGHWNYDPGFIVPTIYVVSNGDSVAIEQNGKVIAPAEHSHRFLYTFKDVPCLGERLVARSFDANGNQVSMDEKITAGAPVALKLTAIENPTGWKADGNDVVLVQYEVVDANGRRCPLDNRNVKFSLDGPAEWRGGVAKNKPYEFYTNDAALNSTSISAEGKNKEYDEKRFATLNHVLCDTVPVECGVNRVMLRSFPKAGKVKLTACADGLPKAEIEFVTKEIKVTGGLTEYRPTDGLKPVLDRGATPSAPSFKPWRREVAIMDAVAGSGDPTLSFDTFENTAWESVNELDSAWVTYTLSENTRIDEICLKPKGFRQTSYPIRVFAHPEGAEDGVLIWEGWTPKGLGFTHLPIAADAPKSNKYTIKLVGSSTTKDAFGAIKEMDSRNDEKAAKGGRSLKILEIEFLRNL